MIAIGSCRPFFSMSALVSRSSSDDISGNKSAAGWIGMSSRQDFGAACFAAIVGVGVCALMARLSGPCTGRLFGVPSASRLLRLVTEMPRRLWTPTQAALSFRSAKARRRPFLKLRQFRQRIAALVVTRVEFRELGFDCELFGLKRFVARRERLDDDAMDQRAPLGFLKMLALAGERVQRDADVEQCAARVIVPIEEAARDDALPDEPQRLVGDVALAIGVPACERARPVLRLPERQHVDAVGVLVVIGDAEGVAPI